MHGAPSVIYPVGRSRFEGLLILAACAAAAAGLIGWALRADPGPAALLAAAVLALATAALALAGWWRTPGRRLQWDGEGWLLDGQALAAVDAVADLQRLLVLRCRRAAGGTAWLWPERDSDPSHWHGLRRAVYSRARPDAPPDEPSGPAET
ncbi:MULTISPECIES: hypothetical protein [Ramlibacter]|uniref:Toxin CptA n=1 Tax=Ramlibacter aquaticus TaxID=2780094 RepID=A0ABR9SHY3_9BURK|nr:MULTISPECIES: hypothetical protein [Ramlibacter]MBE7941953.1 hypothetical protein [Ramlibacter aquaticus]